MNTYLVNLLAHRLLLTAIVAGLWVGSLQADVLSNVTATASSSYVFGADRRTPDKAINGVGLTGDAHDTLDTNMWLTANSTVVSGSWFRVDLEQECNVQSMRVWNCNSTGNFRKRGVARADVYTGMDVGTNAPGGPGWSLLDSDRAFTIAPGNASYNTPDAVTVDRVARYLGLLIHTNHVSNDPYVGLSEVQVQGTPLPVELIEGVTATASSTLGGGVRTPAKAVSGAGLLGTAHTADVADMWLSDIGTVVPVVGSWFRMDLGKVHDVARMDVWNYNESGSPGALRGIKFGDVYVAEVDPGTPPPGAGWTLARTDQFFAMATGLAGYSTPSRVPIHRHARYVAIVVDSIYGNTGIAAQNYVGLSEVQFWATPPPRGSLISIK